MIARHPLRLLVLVPAAVFALSTPALAQRGGGPGGQQQGSGSAGTNGKGAQIAQVGAGTTDGTTTGVSGPTGGGGPAGMPPPPRASLCDSYSGDVQKACLDVVLRQGDKPGGRQNNGSK